MMDADSIYEKACGDSRIQEWIRQRWTPLMCDETNRGWVVEFFGELSPQEVVVIDYDRKLPNGYNYPLDDVYFLPSLEWLLDQLDKTLEEECGSKNWEINCYINHIHSLPYSISVITYSPATIRQFDEKTMKRVALSAWVWYKSGLRMQEDGTWK